MRRSFERQLASGGGTMPGVLSAAGGPGGFRMSSKDGGAAVMHMDCKEKRKKELKCCDHLFCVTTAESKAHGRSYGGREVPTAQ